MTEQGIRLIVGLGNPGSEYARTRHNAGFWFVDELARKTGAFFRDERKFQGEVCRTRIGDSDVWLLKPSTYMNRSGDAVVALALYYKITPDQILVVHDELDLPPGCMKIKQGGGNAGHNGLKDITQRLATGDFWRLRVGIGHPRQLCPGMAVIDWVLGRATTEQSEGISKCLEGALKAIDNLALGKFEGAERTIGKFAHPPKPAKTEKTPEKQEPAAQA